MRAGDGVTERALARLERYVMLETPSGEGDRIRALIRVIADDLQALGADVEVLDAGEAGANLHARISGAEPALEPLLLLAHIDTVWPAGTTAERPFRVNGDRAEGPGTYDMKAGLTLAIEALAALRADGRKPARPLDLLVTCDEEVGSRTSRPHIERLALASAGVLVFEPSIPGGAAKTARKGIVDLRLSVQGRATHSGLEPQSGISAIEELARQIPVMLGLADLAQGTTVNVGRVGGGSATNVVAANAWADVEARFWTAAEGERVLAALRALQPHHPGATLSWKQEGGRPPFERTPGVAALYERARHAAATIGFDLREGRAGGASDGSLTAGLGVPTLDGLGPDGGGAHAIDEHILISDIAPRVALHATLLATL